MKRLSTWDTYVREAKRNGDRSIELPLTEDETFILHYPTRKQARVIAGAQRSGDMDALLIGLLGKKAGTRVKDLADDQPAYVLDEFLMDVMRKFGIVRDDEGDTEDADEYIDEDGDEDMNDAPVNGATVDAVTAGKDGTPKSKTASKRSLAVSS